MKRGLAVAVTSCFGIPILLSAAPSYADATRDNQWHVNALRLPEAQKITQGEGVIVAVIDSGINQNHPDLIGNVLPGKDVAAGGNGNGWGDANGHGTAMAGLIAAHGHGIGMRDGALGVAPKAKILPVRVSTTAEDVATPGQYYAEAVRWAVSHGARIISISASVGPGLFEAVKEAHDAGVIVVGGAGNTSKDVVTGAPANFDGYAIAVAGTDRNGGHASISLVSSSVDIAAPAVGVISTNNDSAYRTGTGTSDSTAIVAGALALIWSKYPTLERDEVIYRLLATAIDKGPKGKDAETGNGLINIVAALATDFDPPPSIRQTAATPAVTSGTSSADSSNIPNGNLSVALAIVGIGLGVVSIIVLVARRRNRKP